MEPNPEKLNEDEETIFFLIMIFNPKNDQLRDIVIENWDILKRSSVTKDLSTKKSCFWIQKMSKFEGHAGMGKIETQKGCQSAPKFIKGWKE